MLEPNGKFKYIQIIWIQFNTSTKSTNACCLNIFKSEVGMVQQAWTSLNTHTAQPATVWTHLFGPTMSHAFSKFSLQMDAPKPYLVLLALKIASSSSWHSTWNMVKHAWNIVKVRCGGWDTFLLKGWKAESLLVDVQPIWIDASAISTVSAAERPCRTSLAPLGQTAPHPRAVCPGTTLCHSGFAHFRSEWQQN